MTEALANLLINRLEAPGRWPIDSERNVIALVAKWAGFREIDREVIRHVANVADDADYVVDPIAEKIAEAYGDLLFGEDPMIQPASKDDADRLADIIQESDLFGELRRAEEICVSEGEVWWRIFVNREAAVHPLIEFHSREDVIPHWIGPKLVAVAWVNEFVGAETEEGGDKERIIYRHFEIHSRGRVENRLYKGTKDTLGQKLDLAEHPETKGLTEVWDHGLDGMLAGRVPNKVPRDRRLGKSDYHGIEDFLLALNEAMTIGQANARLTLKRRATMPRSAARASTSETVDQGDGTLVQVAKPVVELDEDVILVDEVDRELGKSDSNFKVLEYSFDAPALIEYVRMLVTTTLTRVGITPQFVGSYAGTDGQAETGTALRVRLLPTTSAGQGKGRYWDRALPMMLMLAQLLDNAPEDLSGFQREWQRAGAAPSIERKDPLPEDRTEEVIRHTTAVQGEIEARKTAIEELHPDWDEKRVGEELDSIREQSQASMPQPPTPPRPPGETG